MKRRLFAEEQVIWVLREQKTGAKATCAAKLAATDQSSDNCRLKAQWQVTALTKQDRWTNGKQMQQERLAA